MKKYVIMTAIFILVAGVGYYFWNGNEKIENSPVGQVQRVVKVVRGDLSLNVSANGVVQPINKVDIKSKASGIVIKMSFEEGQYVQKGTGLLELDTTTTKNDYDQAKADLELAQSSLAQKENDFHRSVELFSKSLISQQERDQSEVTYISAKSQLVKARAALSSAEDRLRDTKISAPISGVILSRSVEIGQIIASGVSNVGGGTLIATIADMDQVHVETNVDEVDIGKVQVGQTARVVADAYPDDAFYGSIERIAPLGKTQQNVTTFNVIILVKNTNGKLKAGMSASVDIEVFNRKNVLLVPNEALKDPRSEQGRAMMAAANLTLPEQPVVKPVGDSPTEQVSPNAGGTADIQKLRQQMQNASPEEREKLRAKLREQFEKMSPEERQKMFGQMRGRFQQGGRQGGGRGEEGDGGQGFASGEQGGATQRPRRQSQISNQGDVHWRLLVLKEGAEFKPHLVKVGASNFDNSEIVDGVQEGSEIQITTISRAKIASEQFNDRMRAQTSIGGIGGGSNRTVSRAAGR